MRARRFSWVALVLLAGCGGKAVATNDATCEGAACGGDAPSGDGGRSEPAPEAGIVQIPEPHGGLCEGVASNHACSCFGAPYVGFITLNDSGDPPRAGFQLRFGDPRHSAVYDHEDTCGACALPEGNPLVELDPCTGGVVRLAACNSYIGEPPCVWLEAGPDGFTGTYADVDGAQLPFLDVTLQPDPEAEASMVRGSLEFALPDGRHATGTFAGCLSQRLDCQL